MSHAAIAERYGRALFELADEGGNLALVTQQIRAFADAFVASPELVAVLANPVVEESSRDAILKELGARLGASTVALNAVRLMAVRHRLGALPEMASVLARLGDEKAGVLRATVTSPKPLSDEYCRLLSSELEKQYSRKILLERREDPTLIAGVVTRVGDHTLDGSVRGRLAAIERQLLAGT